MSEIKEVFKRFGVVAPLTLEVGYGTFVTARGGYDSLELVFRGPERITAEIQESEISGSYNIYRLMGKGMEQGLPLIGMTTAITLMGCLLIADFFRRAERARQKYHPGVKKPN